MEKETKVWLIKIKAAIKRSSQRRCSVKKVFLQMSQNSQEKTSGRVSFLIKLQALSCIFIKKETLAQVLSCEFCEISKNTFFTEHPWRTASELKENLIFLKLKTVGKQYKTCISKKDKLLFLILRIFALLENSEAVFFTSY